MAIHYDPRALQALSFHQLQVRYPRYADALLLLTACRIVPVASLIAFAGAGLKTRQGRNHLRRQISDLSFAEALSYDRSLVKLGRHGSRVLRRAGIDAPYRLAPAERMVTGLALAGEFAASVLAEVLASGRARAVCWRELPFTGPGLRPDGECSIIWWSAAEQHAQTSLTPHWPLRQNGEHGLLLALEVDAATEDHRQLREKLERWSRRLVGEQPGQTVAFWLTTGGTGRSENLRELWRQHIAPQYMALFASVEQVRRGALLNPLQVTWVTASGERTSGWNVVNRLSRSERGARAPWEF